MGRVRFTDGSVRLLEPLVTLGRRGTIPVTHGKASATHAELRWTGETWGLRDLGSSHGTWADGKPIQVGLVHPLRPGARIHLGDPDEADLVLEDAGEPRAIARRQDGVEVEEGDDGCIRTPDGVFTPGADGGWLTPTGESMSGAFGRWRVV